MKRKSHKATIHSYEVSKYVINYFGGGKRSIRPYKFRAIISLYNKKRLIGELRFHRHESTLPASDELIGERQVVSHFPAADFLPVSDFLRNEKPVFLHYYDHLPTMAHLSTDEEPVGEGELDGTPLCDHSDILRGAPDS